MIVVTAVNQIMKLHNEGMAVGQIAESLSISEIEVRSTIAGQWNEDKKRQSVAEKVAGRLGKSVRN